MPHAFDTAAVEHSYRGKHGITLALDMLSPVPHVRAVAAEKYAEVGLSDVVAEDQLSADQRAERGSHVGCIAGALSVGEYRALLEAAGFLDVAVTFTHPVADGMHGAIVSGVVPGR